MARLWKKWLIGWHRLDHELLLRQLSEFQWSGLGHIDALITHSNIHPLHFTINPVCEVFHPTVIILMSAVCTAFGGRRKKNTFTKQDTQSQSVAFNSWILTMGIIIFSKYRHNNVQGHNYNHVGTTQVTGAGDWL